MNDAEKLISRLILQPEPDTDEDGAFESGVFFVIGFEAFYLVSTIALRTVT